MKRFYLLGNEALNAFEDEDIARVAEVIFRGDGMLVSFDPKTDNPTFLVSSSIWYNCFKKIDQIDANRICACTPSSEEQSYSDCCDAEIENGICTECKEHQ